MQTNKANKSSLESTLLTFIIQKSWRAGYVSMYIEKQGKYHDKKQSRVVFSR